MSQWFFTKGGQQHGPVAAEKLKELAATGQLHQDDLVWQDGMVDWAKAGAVKGLFSASPAASSAGSGSELPAAASSATSATSVPPQRQSDMAPSPGLPKAGTRKHPVIKGILVALALLFVASLVSRGCGRTGDIASTSSGEKQTASGVAANSSDPKWGFLDTAGKVAIDFQFDDVQPFSQGLCAALKNGKWGYIDKTGKTVIDFQFDSAEKFSEGAAFVTKSNERLSIDSKGKTLFAHTFDHCELFSEGLAVVRVGEKGEKAKYGVIDKSGKTVVAPSYSGIQPFSEGVAVVQVGEGSSSKNGAIDKSGNVILKPIYLSVNDFHDGAAVVSVGERDPGPTEFGIVNTAGHFVLPLQGEMKIAPAYSLKDRGFGFRDGLVNFFSLSAVTAGYLDTGGKVVISPENTEASLESGNFAEGLAAATFVLPPGGLRSTEQGLALSARMNKVGYINKTGRWAIEPQFQAGREFSEGLAAIQMESGGKWGFIDRTGKLVIPLQFDAAGYFGDGIAWVKMGDRYGFINTKGENVISGQYAKEQFKHTEEHEDCVASEGLVPLKLPPGEVASRPHAVPGDVVHDGAGKAESKITTTPEAPSTGVQGGVIHDTPRPKEKQLASTDKPGELGERPQATSVQPKQEHEEGRKSSANSQLPHGAILVLTFDDDTLRRKNDVPTEVADQSGNGLVGKLKGALVVPGKVGNGLELGDGRSFNVAGDFPRGKQPRTMAAWLKQTEGSRSGCALSYGNAADAGLFGIYGGNVWKFTGWGKATTVSTNLKVDTDWHHHCVTYDGLELRYYFDARLVAKENIDLDTGPKQLSAGGSVNVFHGVIDEVAVFDRALSSEEIQKLYQMGENGASLAAPSDR